MRGFGPSRVRSGGRALRVVGRGGRVRSPHSQRRRDFPRVATRVARPRTRKYHPRPRARGRVDPRGLRATPPRRATTRTRAKNWNAFQFASRVRVSSRLRRVSSRFRRSRRDPRGRRRASTRLRAVLRRARRSRDRRAGAPHDDGRVPLGTVREASGVVRRRVRDRRRTRGVRARVPTRKFSRRVRRVPRRVGVRRRAKGGRRRGRRGNRETREDVPGTRARSTRDRTRTRCRRRGRAIDRAFDDDVHRELVGRLVAAENLSSASFTSVSGSRRGEPSRGARGSRGGGTDHVLVFDARVG